MPRIHTSHSLLLLVMLAAAACGDRDAQAGVATPGVAAPGERGTAEGSATGGEDRSSDGTTPGRVEVAIDIQPFPGTHQLAGEMQCHVFDGTWQAGIEQERDRGLSGVLLMLQGVPATGGTTDRVTFAATFGANVMDEVDPNSGLVEIHGAEIGGDARGTVTREGAGAVLTVEGTTHYGARVAATVRCDTVDVMQ